MIFSHAVPFFLLGLAAALPAEDTQLLSTRKTKCAAGVHIIQVRGNPDGHSNATTGQQGFGITKPLIKAIEKAVPHSTASSVAYPKTGNAKHRKSVAVKHQTSELEDYVKACPDSAVVLSGYSEGASITMDTVCGQNQGLDFKGKPLNPKYTKNVIAVIAYSDDSRTIGASYNYGSCFLPGPSPRTEPGKCKPYADVIRSYCNFGDKNCCLGGFVHHAHYTYFKMYDTEVAQYIKSQFQKFQGK